MTGFEYANVTNWDNQYDKTLQFVGPEDLRGRPRLLPEPVKEHIVQCARQAQKESEGTEKAQPFRVTDFCQALAASWPPALGPAPCRQSVTEILIGNGLYQAEPGKERPQESQPVRRYYPGAQSAVDGHEVPVIIGGERYTYNVEFCRGLETGAITGHAVTDEETGDAVMKVLQQSLAAAPPPRKLLSDSRSSNLDHRVQALLQEQEIEHELVPDWKSNGGLEGEFGNFSKVVGQQILLEGETKRDIARSALRHIVHVYVQLRRPPRRSAADPAAQPKTPEEEARLDQEMKAADARRRERGRPDVPQEKKDEIAFILHHLGLQVQDAPWFERNLARYDLKALREARDAYVITSGREAFDPGKAIGPYFLGIVKNKQKAIDLARQEAKAREKHSLDRQSKARRQEIQAEIEARREQQRQRRDPVAAILRKLEILRPAPKTIRLRMKSLLDEIAAILKRLTPERVQELFEKVRQTFGRAAEEFHAILLSLKPEFSV